MTKEDLYLLGERLSHFLPKSLMKVLMRALAVPLGRRSGALRAVEENLSCVLNSQRAGGSAKIRKLSKENLKNFAEALCEVAYCRRLSDAFIEERVEIQGLPHLEEALSKKRGVILVGAHVGNWELGGMAIARKGYPLTAIVLRHKNPALDEAFQKRRALNGVNIIPLGGALKNCYALLEKNGILAILGDRSFTGRGIQVDFLGKKTVYPIGAARFALETGAALLPVSFVALRESLRKYLLEVKPPLEGLTEEALTRAFSKQVEEMVKSAPEQWFDFQRFWEPA